MVVPGVRVVAGFGRFFVLGRSAGGALPLATAAVDADAAVDTVGEIGCFGG